VTAGNVLYYGDNLDVLREHIPDESVDLIYLDPPFNSNATYNVLFKTHAGDESRAQIQAFDDTWHWGPQAEDEYDELTKGRAPIETARFIEAMRTVLGANDMLAYLVMMAPRLIELRRAMKPTATIYLHCDPTSSHYLKLLMDTVFGKQGFINEIIWHYQTGGGSKRHFSKKHDTLLFYCKTAQYLFYPQNVKIPRTEKSLARARNPKGARISVDDTEKLPEDVFDIQALNPMSRERLGYPTQKPLELLERVIAASSSPDDVVLDPFCGCGTAVDAAQQLKRSWIGIDITYIAVDLIIKRLQHRYGNDILATFTTNGIPTDIEGAEALFARNPFDFERWAVSFVSGQPNEKQVGDKGIDGRIRFHRGGDVAGLAAVSVKGGRQLNPAMVHQLIGAMGDERAEMGVLITLHRPTAGMLETASRVGTYEHAPTGNRYPRVQIVTIPELFDGERPNMPTAILPYIKASPRPQSEAVSLFDDESG
jgi:site-specific DNA-methyltransferase (adenine-specific)